MGLFIATALTAIWGISLVTLLAVELNPLLRPLALMWMTFLYTGLFITAHDAMHGTVSPGHHRVNLWVGRIVLLLYALFSFEALRREHFKHHRYPSSGRDPDYHDGVHRGPVAWYLRFMRHYLTPLQVTGMAVLFNLLYHLASVPVHRLILFWAGPALLSTVQLFTFGTYLTHREPRTGYIEPHRTRSLALNTAASFLACYHFGYHWEHHAFPGQPWWRLPRVRRENG